MKTIDMVIEIINQTKPLLTMIMGLCVPAIACGAYFANHLKKNNRAIINGVLLDVSTKERCDSYLSLCNKSSTQMYSNNKRLIDYESGLRNLEHIPSGKVSKMFINGRGSWRLTQGNILTEEYLVNAIRRENKQRI